MSDTSQNTLSFAEQGGFGGQYLITGISGAVGTAVGNFFKIDAVSEACVLTENTSGNMTNISGLLIPQGSHIVGQFTSVEISSGSAIIYGR